MAKSSAITGELAGLEVKPTNAYTDLETLIPDWLCTITHTVSSPAKRMFVWTLITLISA